MGDEFQKQMKMWLLEHPEVKHTWDNGTLRIWHPCSPSKLINFDLSPNSIVIEYENKRTEFKKERFKNLEEQVFRIRGFWINELLPKKELEIRRPKILEEQFLLLMTNQKYGQVLTVDGNLFTGWGDVFKIFNDLESAKNYGFEKQDSGFECLIFDSNHELIEEIK